MRKSAANGILWIVTVSAAAVAVATRILAQGSADVDRYFCGPHMMWWNGGSYGMIFGPFFMILGLAVVIALIVLLGRWLGGLSFSTTSPARTALDILKERFACGEIDKDEYEERRLILGG